MKLLETNHWMYIFQLINFLETTPVKVGFRTQLNNLVKEKKSLLWSLFYKHWAEMLVAIADTLSQKHTSSTNYSLEICF